MQMKWNEWNGIQMNGDSTGAIRFGTDHSAGGKVHMCQDKTVTPS